MLIPDYRNNFRNKLKKGSQADMYLLGYREAIDDLADFWENYYEDEPGTINKIIREIVDDVKVSINEWMDSKERLTVCNVVEDTLTTEDWNDEELDKICQEQNPNLFK